MFHRCHYFNIIEMRTNEAEQTVHKFDYFLRIIRVTDRGTRDSSRKRIVFVKNNVI